MPQDPASAGSQWVGNPGYLVLSCLPVDTISGVSVSFTPAYVRCPQFEYAPLQRINLSVNGTLHVFEIATNETLTLPTIWHDLPFFDGTADPRGNYTQGLKSLLSFIRYTLSYYANSCTIMTPDGFIEHVQYYGGIDSFQEGSDGQNMSPRSQRWAGSISWIRCQ